MRNQTIYVRKAKNKPGEYELEERVGRYCGGAMDVARLECVGTIIEVRPNA